MRRHHETAAPVIVSALAMVIPVAGGLWLRLLSLRGPAPAPTKPAEATHEQEQ